MGRRSASLVDDIDKELASVNQETEETIGEIAKLRGDMLYYPLLLDATNTTMSHGVVKNVYEDLRERFGACGEQLMVAVRSAGGDIDAAYNLTTIFCRYGKDCLIVVVPRWAKSAATLLVCGGDEILMTPIAELGPLDLQITEFNPLDGRMEHFSPLHIKSTLDLISQQYADNKDKLADGLLNRLQFSLTLGAFTKSLDIGKEYVKKLLSRRMLQGDVEKAVAIAHKLVEGYADHNACITLEEAQEMGLNVNELTDDEVGYALKVERSQRRKTELIKEKKQKETEQKLRDLPPELVEELLNALRGQVSSIKEAA
jgi:hypothetical protein